MAAVSARPQTVAEDYGTRWEVGDPPPMVGDMDIVIAGGGVAGLEALLALGALAGDRARLRLISPDPEFAYKPLAVAEPFALGSTLRVPLERIAGAAGAELIRGAVESVDDAAGEVRLDSRRARRPGAPAATRPSTAACCATSRRATPASSRSSSRPARPGRCPRTSLR